MFAATDSMSFLQNNHRRIQNLTRLEVWSFITGRVLAAFGLGILAMEGFPQFVGWLSIPCIVVGFALFALAVRGLSRKPPTEDHTA